METKWTPGPWVALSDEQVPDRGAVYVNGPNGWDEDAICACDYSGHGREREEANAHLIAAAPDLYAALENLLEEVAARVDDECDCLQCKRYRAGAAALAKARGETP